MWFRIKLIVLLNLCIKVGMSTVCKKCFRSVSLVWGVSVVIAILVNMLVVAPQKELKEQIAAQLAGKKKIYSDLLKLQQEKTRLRLNIQMAQWRDSLRDYVTSSQDLAGLTFDLGKIAKELKVASFTINPDLARETLNPAEGQYISESRMNVNFKSSFNKFAKFLNAVERYQPVIFVNKFTISHWENDDSTNNITMDISVFTKKQGT